jgi:hypothetical protein
MTVKNIKDHGKTLEEKSLLGPLTEYEFIAWCLEDGVKSRINEFLDNPHPSELDELTDEELEAVMCPGLNLGDDEFF